MTQPIRATFPGKAMPPRDGSPFPTARRRGRGSGDWGGPGNGAVRCFDRLCGATLAFPGLRRRPGAGRGQAEEADVQRVASFSGGRLWARAARSTTWIALGYAGGQALRLGSNLVLTRLLFPEAFGLMTLVTVLLVGLAMFSDVGLGPSISRSPRGDEPDFLNTGWTLQVVRGVGLWIATCVLAWPAAAFYGEPLLAHILPVAGLTLLVQGFYPTRMLTAHRHLSVGRLTLLELGGQAAGIATMIVLAALMQSVWALVIGGIAGAAATLVLTWRHLPGARNRLRWDRTVVRDLVGFGKWIFLSTVMGFFLSQGDKAVLGKFLPLDALGIYNIGFFMASFPTLLGLAVVSRVMIPLYRERPPAASPANFARLRRFRSTLTGGLLALLIVLAFAGVPLIELLYDPRYHAAGAIMVMIACAQMPVVIGMTYDQVALAAGDSRRYFALTSVRTALQLTCLIAGVAGWGLAGALVGQAAAAILAHPFVALLARRHAAWDPLHDAGFAVIAAAAAASALWLNWPALQALQHIAGG